MIKRSLLFLTFIGVVLFATSTSRAATLVVDDDHVQCPTAAYSSIQAAVNAASPGDTIKVCRGTYPENVLVDRTLRLRGAQAGNSFSGRTFPSTNESTVAGSFTVQAPNVTIDGFSVTSPLQSFGILVKTVGNDALLVNNIIYQIGNANFTPNTTAIYLEYGPDRVKIVSNWISTVQSVPSAQGILVGDSTSADPSLNILIIGNRIEKITSTRGAYGIQVNNGASTAATATGYTTVAILCNTIDSLTGQWAHAIGLEGDTPGAIVDGNSISNLVDFNPTPIADAIAVFFQDNPSFPTAHVNQNNFDVTIAAYGIAVDPSLRDPTGHFVVGLLTGGPVDGTRNWWGNSSGPGPVGPGTGAKVSANVLYSPWLRSRASVCADNDNNGHDRDDDKDKDKDKDKDHGHDDDHGNDHDRDGH